MTLNRLYQQSIKYRLKEPKKEKPPDQAAQYGGRKENQHWVATYIAYGINVNFVCSNCVCLIKTF